MLTQGEADVLLGMGKRFDSGTPLDVAPGVFYTRQLQSLDQTESFLLDVSASEFKLSKFRYQSRGRRIHILARLCIDGTPHTNPDGERMEGTHVHFYREGYEDKWAYPVDPKMFVDVTDRESTLSNFLGLCNVEDPPPIIEIGHLQP